MGLLNALKDLPEVHQLIRAGFLKAESADNPQAVKRAFTSYQKAVSESPAMKRRAAQMGDTVKTVENIGERNIVTPEDIYRAQYALVPVSGDTLVTGHTIHKLAGIPVNDVVVGGGPLYGLWNEGKGWASMFDRAEAKQRHFNLAANETGRPVLGVYNRMGDKSHDFAAPVTQLMVEGARANQVPKTLWSALDKDVWNALDVYKDGVLTRKGKDRFIGFSRDPEAAYSQLLGENGFPKEGSGALRTAFMDRAGLAGYRNQGMPSRSEIMDAVTEPELRDVPIGGSGFGMFVARPNAGLLPDTRNMSYDAGIQGDWLGGTEYSVPLQTMFPDMYKEFSMRKNKRGEFLSPQEIQGTFVADTGSYQLPTQQWLDNVSGFIDDRKRLAALGLTAASGFAGAQEKDAGGKNGLLDKAAQVQMSGGDTADAADPEAALFQSAGGAGEPMNLKNLKNYGLDLLRAGKGLITGATGIAGDTESLGRGLLSIPSRSPDQSRFGAFLSGLEEPTLLPTSKDINRYIDPLMPQSLQGEAGVPQQIGEFMAPGGLLMKAAEKSAPMVKKGLLSLPTDLPVGASVRPVVNAPVSDIGMYSALEEAGLNLQRNKGTGQAFLNDLLKAPNVKQEEVRWIGLDDYLKDKPNATKQDVQNFIANNRVDVQEVQLGATNFESMNDAQLANEYARIRGYEPKDSYGDPMSREEILHELSGMNPADSGATKFGKYTLPGGENYREILLTMPESSTMRGGWGTIDDEGSIVARFNSESEAKKSALENGLTYDKVQPSAGSVYKSSHWDQPNVLAHLRVNDRVDADGKKMLLVEEVQSDWHQAGRDKGYQGQGKTAQQLNEELSQINLERSKLLEYAANLPDSKMEEFKKVNEKIKQLGDKAQEIDRQWGEAVRAGPKVPDAPFKDNWYQLALKRAIKYAADNGYDRIGLTTGARQVERYDLSKQIGYLAVIPKKNDMVRVVANKDGVLVFEKVVRKNQLADYVGKDMAKKAISDIDAGKNAQYSDLDLQVGGEGMKKYYDEIYPQFLAKYGKKWGAKVGETTINLHKDLEGFMPRKDMQIESVRYIDITPEMKESVKKGQPLFAAVPAVPLASTYQNQGESSTIKQPGTNKKQSGLLNSF